MRRKKKNFLSGSFKREADEAIAREKKRFAKQLESRIKRIRRTYSDRDNKFKKAVAKFRPKKEDKGSIVFVTIDGKRGKKFSDRKGYAVYVNTKGKKTGIKQYNSHMGRTEKIPVARKISSIDVNKVRSKRAKAKFWRVYTNEVVSGKLESLDKIGKVPNSTVGSGSSDSSRIDIDSDMVSRLAKELEHLTNITKSKKDFLVTVGIHIRDSDGKQRFIYTQQRFSRLDKQKADFADCREFFGRLIYGFLATELSKLGLVLEGSAKHVSRLKINKGKKRSKWEKVMTYADGRRHQTIWQGWDYQDVVIEKVEYRIDHLRLGK